MDNVVKIDYSKCVTNFNFSTNEEEYQCKYCGFMFDKSYQPTNIDCNIKCLGNSIKECPFNRIIKDNLAVKQINHNLYKLNFPNNKGSVLMNGETLKDFNESLKEIINNDDELKKCFLSEWKESDRKYFEEMYNRPNESREESASPSRVKTGDGLLSKIMDKEVTPSLTTDKIISILNDFEDTINKDIIFISKTKSLRHTGKYNNLKELLTINNIKFRENSFGLVIDKKQLESNKELLDKIYIEILKFLPE